MGFIPVQPRQTREMRERYRKTRRRQQAQLLLAGCAVLLGLSGIVFIWRAIARALNPPPPPQSVQAATQQDDTDEAQDSAAQAAARPRAGAIKLPPAPGLRAVADLSYDPGPWLLDSDGVSVFSATDARPFSDPAAYYTCDELQARKLRGGKGAWVQSGEYKLSDLDYAAGMLIGLQESPSDKKLLLTGYNATTGEQTWTAEIAEAANPQLYARGEHVILTYSSTGGYRIVCYNSATGAKAWGYKPALRGLNRGLLARQDDQGLQTFQSGSHLVYVLSNVIGILDIRRGKLERNEFTASGPLVSTVIEEESKTVFIKMLGNTAGSSSILTIPLEAGEPRFVQRVLSADERVLFVPGPEWLLTAYRKLEGATPRLVIESRRWQKENSDPVRNELAGGHALCGARVPGSSSYLIGVAAESSIKESAGARQFYLVTPEALDLREAGRTAQPSYDILPFAGNLIAVGDGGQLQLFDPLRLAFRNLRKLRYPELVLQFSDDSTTLLAYATTRDYMEGKPGEPLQAVAFR